MIFKEISSKKDRYFSTAIDIYNEAFRDSPDIYLDPKYFENSPGRDLKDMEWHFYALIDVEVVGMATFASTILGGYGGYVAVGKKFRNNGYGTILLNNIKSVLKENSTRRNWNMNFLFAEYEEHNRNLWESKGFITLPVNYFQPPLHSESNWIKMHLGIVPLEERRKITGREIVDFVEFLYSRIYGFNSYSKSEHFIGFVDSIGFEMYPV